MRAGDLRGQGICAGKFGSYYLAHEFSTAAFFPGAPQQFPLHTPNQTPTIIYSVMQDSERLQLIMLPNSIPRPPQEPTEDVSEVSYNSLRNELSGCVFRYVKGFYAKYFEEKSWSTAAKQVVQKVQPTVASGLCIDFLEIRSQESLSAWLDRFQSMFPTKEQIHYRFRSRQIGNSGDPLRANVCLVASDQPKSSSPSTAVNARVFGESNANASSTDPEDVLRFCESARQVFQTQPTRRFLHGFQICGSMMELWVFDRSGAYSCEKLDIGQRPDLLIKTIASYTMMNDEEVGFNSFIRLDGLGSYIAFSGVDGNEAERFYLEDEPIAAPQYIVGSGTTY